MNIPEPVLEWLLENGGPVVRWRTANELIEKSSQTERARRSAEMLEAPVVQAWLDRLSLGELENRLENLDEKLLGRLGGMVHGSKDICLENVLGKLAEFGLRAGMPGLDKRLLPLMRIFRWRSDWKSDATFQNAWETLVKSVFAWGLLRLGYTPDAAMSDFLLAHLDACHKIARDRVYDIYADEAELVGLPKAWAGKPILKQEVMANYWLPYIHDSYVFANLPAGFLDESGQQKVDELVRYILEPRFQSLKEGYGYAWIKERRTCYGWGWSPHLPGFFGFTWGKAHQPQGLVQRLELMAHFAEARRSAWLQASLEHLAQYQDEGGRYQFPASYLAEHEGYYVSGAHMGLGQTPRNLSAREIESTFRALKIRSLLPG